MELSARSRECWCLKHHTPVVVFFTSTRVWCIGITSLSSPFLLCGWTMDINQGQMNKLSGGVFTELFL